MNLIARSGGLSFIIGVSKQQDATFSIQQKKQKIPISCRGFSRQEQKGGIFSICYAWIAVWCPRCLILAFGKMPHDPA
jgi:hypothetical protein